MSVDKILTSNYSGFNLYSVCLYWGEGNKHRDAFREHFSHIGEHRVILPNVQSRQTRKLLRYPRNAYPTTVTLKRSSIG